MRLLHPGVMLGSGVIMAAIGLWGLVGGDTFFGAFCLLIAGLSVPMALASASIRRRIRGDRQPLLERPVMRFGPLIWSVAGAVSLVIGFWSHARGQDALLQFIFFWMAGALWIVVAIYVAGRVLIARAQKRADKEDTASGDS